MPDVDVGAENLAIEAAAQFEQRLNPKRHGFQLAAGMRSGEDGDVVPAPREFPGELERVSLDAAFLGGKFG